MISIGNLCFLSKNDNGTNKTFVYTSILRNIFCPLTILRWKANTLKCEVENCSKVV